MSKKVTFTPKPTIALQKTADEWVSGGVQTEAPAYKTEQGRAGAPTERMKRFTIDVPETLHRRVKARCAEKGVDMAGEMRRLLEEHFPSS